MGEIHAWPRGNLWDCFSAAACRRCWLWPCMGTFSLAACLSLHSAARQLYNIIKFPFFNLLVANYPSKWCVGMVLTRPWDGGEI